MIKFFGGELSRALLTIGAVGGFIVALAFVVTV